MTPELRSAGLGDIEAIVAFWEYAGENRARPPDRSDLVVQLLERDRDSIILAVAEEHIVGTIVAAWDGWRAHLYRLAVDPRLRGQGIARRLLTAAETRLVRLGAERLDAMVLDDNDDGRSLWSRAGFHPQVDWSRWVKPAERPVDNRSG